MELKHHGVTLRGERAVLRPLTEGDWDTLLRWNSDPEVLFFSEGDVVTERSLAEVQGIYRSVCRNAVCFMIEHEGAPIGECWLQEMNLARILDHYPEGDCRRIDLMIGEKALWGRGLGTEVVRLLVRFGFEREGADAIFACDIADYNPRGLALFQRVGFKPHATIPQPPGGKARACYDLILTREDFLSSRV